jgi:hypothetical protein
MTDIGNERVRHITAKLKAAGWSRDAASEQLDWPSFYYVNDEAKLIVEYLPGAEWIRIGMHTEELEGNLKVDFGERLDQVMDIIVSAQTNLGPDGWSAFIDDLLGVPARTYAISGDDGDEIVELRLFNARPE